MKKHYPKILAVVVILLVVWMIAELSQKPRNEGDVPGDSPAANNVGNGIITNRPGLAPRMRGAMFTPGTEAYSNRIANAVVMTEEEAFQIEEAFEITSAMSDFLDDDNHDGALEEARKFVKHPNREVRLAAVQALHWIGAKAAMDIVSYMGDADPEIDALANEAFWQALDEMDDPALKIKVVEPMLRSSNAELRMEVLDMLIYLPDSLSFPVIASLMNDPVEEVRNLAQDNLEFISEERFTSEPEALTWFEKNKDELVSEVSF